MSISLPPASVLSAFRHAAPVPGRTLEQLAQGVMQDHGWQGEPRHDVSEYDDQHECNRVGDYERSVYLFGCHA